MHQMDLQPRKLKFEGLILIYSIVVFFINFENTIAQESAGSAGMFLRMGAGARAMAMGGAFVGMANDPSATYWNPAGLEQIGNLQFEFMYMNLPFDRQFNFVSSVIPVRNILTIGISWLSLRIGNIESRDFNSEESNYTFGNNQNAVCISMGKSINSFLSIGGSVKFIKNDIDNISATGFGLDAALMLHPIEQLKIGLLVQDIGTDLRWNDGYTEGVPINVKFGMSMKVYEGVILTADINKTPGLTPSFQLGGEVRMLNSVPVRIGFNDKQISGGVGFVMPFSGHSLEINYGYAKDEVFNDAIHRISLVFSFGSNSSRIRKPNGGRKITATRSEKKSTSTKTKLMIVVNTKVLNVRSGPGTRFAKIGKILRGEKYQIFNKSGVWRKIILRNGKMGWIHEGYVKFVRM